LRDQQTHEQNEGNKNADCDGRDIRAYRKRPVAPTVRHPNTPKPRQLRPTDREAKIFCGFRRFGKVLPRDSTSAQLMPTCSADTWNMHAWQTQAPFRADASPYRLDEIEFVLNRLFNIADDRLPSAAASEMLRRASALIALLLGLFACLWVTLASSHVSMNASAASSILVAFPRDVPSRHRNLRRHDPFQCRDPALAKMGAFYLNARASRFGSENASKVVVSVAGNCRRRLWADTSRCSIMPVTGQ
jgi:hypothetical protein